MNGIPSYGSIIVMRMWCISVGKELDLMDWQNWGTFFCDLRESTNMFSVLGQKNIAG